MRAALIDVRVVLFGVRASLSALCANFFRRAQPFPPHKGRLSVLRLALFHLHENLPA
jgi:hypothetical protein